MLIKKAVLRIGLANMLSVLSFLASITSLVIVSRISYEYTRSHLSSSPPAIIESKNSPFENAATNPSARSEGYENVFQEMDPDHIDSPSSFDQKNIHSIESAIRAQNAKTRVGTPSMSDNLSEIDQFEAAVEKLSAKSSSENWNEVPKQRKVRTIVPIRAPRHIKNPNANPSQYHSVNQYSEQNTSKTSLFENVGGKMVKIEPGRKDEFRKVQIATFETHSEAIAGWFRMKKEHHATLSPHRYSIDIINDDDGRKLFRLYIDTKNEDEAKSLCKDFKAKKINCVVTQ